MDEAGVQSYITDSITGHASGSMHSRYSIITLDAKYEALTKAMAPLTPCQ
jgi:hypothetical protein